MCRVSCPARPAGAPQALSAAIAQPEEPPLQRRAAAALGELLFYADSQHREGPGAPQPQHVPWDLPPEAVHRLAALLAPGQDEVAQVGGCDGQWV